jgi:hypothetical protein
MTLNVFTTGKSPKIYPWMKWYFSHISVSCFETYVYVCLFLQFLFLNICKCIVCLFTAYMLIMTSSYAQVKNEKTILIYTEPYTYLFKCLSIQAPRPDIFFRFRPRLHWALFLRTDPSICFRLKICFIF